MAKSAQGMTIGVSTLPATSYTDINCTTTVNMEDGEAADIDVTCLSSTAKEYLVGLQDSGSLSLDLNVVFGDAGYVILQTAKASGNKVGFQIELAKEGTETTGRTFTFEGFVKSLPFTGAVDAAITGTASVRISGAVTEADPVTP